MMTSRVWVAPSSACWFNGLHKYLMLTLIIFLTTLSSHTLGHSSHISRGPHHPRNSPRVEPEHHHQHYVPHRDENGAQPKLTRDTQLLHDAE